MYLFIDTETTGLPKDWRAPVEDGEKWPRVVELGWVSYTNRGDRVAGGGGIIKPEGYTIPDATAAIHGITTERAIKEGLPGTKVFDVLQDQVSRARVIVAHNMMFDKKVINAECVRQGRNHIISGKREICTMLATINFCNIMGDAGVKFPRLKELHQVLFGKGVAGAHRALNDAQACADCFWECLKRGIIEA